MNRSRIVEWLRWAAAAGAVALVAACGGGGDAEPAGAGAQAPQAARVEIEQTGLLLTGGGASAQLTAQVSDASGLAVPAPVTWASSRPDAVSVDPNGRVTALATTGSAQIVATSGALTSPPLLVVIAAPAAGVTVLSDVQIAGQPEDTDPTAEPSRNNTYHVTLEAGVGLPAVGERMLGTGSKPLAGQVVMVHAATRRVTLRPLPLRELLPNMSVNEMIDLRQVEPVFPERLLAAYTVTRVGDRYDFTPRATSGTAVPGRERAAAGTRATPVFPFDECRMVLTGVPLEGSAPLPMTLSAPPTFSFAIPARLEIVDTPTNGFERGVLHATPTFTMAAGLRLIAAIDGTFACKVTLAELPIPVGGIFSWVAGGIVGVGVGIEASGRVTLATMEVAATNTTTATLDLGVACGRAGCGLVHEVSNFSNESQPRIDLPSVGDFRVDLSAGLFGFADLEFGTPRTASRAPGIIGRFLRSLRVKVANSKISAKSALSVAPRISQIADEVYRSNYRVTIEARAGLGQSTDIFGDASQTHLEEIARMLGVQAVIAAEATSIVDIARSPTGTASADRARFNAGDSVTFRASLNDVNQIFSGAYNVARVLLVRSVPGGTEVVSRVDATNGQRDFEFTIQPATAGRTDEFYVFVTTRALDFNLPESLELFSFEIARVTAPNVQVAVSPGGTILAPGASQAFTAAVTGTSQTDVTWSASAGSITAGGVFTAPQQPGSVTVTARSVADPSASASASITVAVRATGWLGTIIVEYLRVMEENLTSTIDPVLGTGFNTFTSSHREQATATLDMLADNRPGTGVPLVALGAAVTGSLTARNTQDGDFRSAFDGCFATIRSLREVLAETAVGAVPSAASASLTLFADGRYTIGPVEVSTGLTGTERMLHIATATGDCGENGTSNSTQPFTHTIRASVPSLEGVLQDGAIRGVASTSVPIANGGQIIGSETITVRWNLQLQ